MNYVLEVAEGTLVACGVIPPQHTIPIHSTALNLHDLILRVSLWGCDYCQSIPLKNIKGMCHVHLKGNNNDDYGY